MLFLALVTILLTAKPFEPWHVISKKCDILTSVDSDEPAQKF